MIIMHNLSQISLLEIIQTMSGPLQITAKILKFCRISRNYQEIMRFAKQNSNADNAQKVRFIGIVSYG